MGGLKEGLHQIEKFSLLPFQVELQLHSECAQTTSLAVGVAAVVPAVRSLLNK